jgi:hypothetical protein
MFLDKDGCIYFLLCKASVVGDGPLFCRPRTERTFCTTNQECLLGGQAAPSCALVGDFTLGNSYGSLPCSLCPSSEPVCLVTDTSSQGTVGVCTCLQQPTPLQSCSSADLSMRVFPDASQMCAVSLHSGASSRSVSALYDWNFLATCPCILISASNAYCYEVSGYGMLVVGHGLVRTSSSLFLGDSGRRRLLSLHPSSANGFLHANHSAYGGNNTTSGSEKFFERARLQIIHEGVISFARWDHTAQPCRGLAEAFLSAVKEEGVPPTGSSEGVSMGVLDTEALESCIHWREVGRSIIRTLNLTSMRSSTHLQHKAGEVEEEEDCCSHLFMSLKDFLSVLVQAKGASLQLVENAPAVIEMLFKSSRLYENVMEAYDALRQHAVLYYLETLWMHVAGVNGTTSGGSNAYNRSFSDANSTEIRLMRRFMRMQKLQVALFHAYTSEVFSVQNFAHVNHDDWKAAANVGARDGGGQGNASGVHRNTYPSAAGRRLLQQSRVGGEPSVVDSYSSLVASTKGFSNVAVSSMASKQKVSSIPLVTDTWLEGPFGWPPRYEELCACYQCAAAAQLF